MTPTTYGRDFAYCLKSHGGVRGFNASLWRFLLRCTLFCHSVATFLTSVSSYEGGCGFEVYLKLIQFREQWTRNSKNEEDVKKSIEPIHLVFIEEPEAHLHAQAQQVFIRKALEALTNAAENNALKENPNLTTQLIVSTHSNHIVNEVDMNCLRYFRRVLDEIIGIPVSKVVNMSRTFGENENDTKKFVTRYIKLTHCDIFFADAAILVEGAAERILMPHFIKREGMDNYYISVMEINGSHAHRFSSLLKKLNILTVIVTDIDAQQEVEEDGKKKKNLAFPKEGKVKRPITIL